MANMVNATDLRQKYCTARIVLEEARLLDKKGDHYSCSEKYGSAAEKFEKIGQALESVQEQREMEFITTLSRAWQKMTLAEAKSSPTLYLDASQLFEEAEDLSLNEKTKMLMLGHKHLCRALEAGTRFAHTRNKSMHTTAVECLESAAEYYIKADFQKASRYVKATGLVFDYYIYVNSAKKEEDPEKKTKLYLMAEKLLQESADAYMEADHPAKRDYVLRLLKKVKEEIDLARSLTEILHAPSVVSTTSFSAPTPTLEKAVGLEKIEHATVQAHLTVSEEATVGEELNVRLDLVNAGKNPSLLIRINELIPPGMKAMLLPSQLSVENNSIDMKGKRLEPLKVESIKLCLQAMKPGIANLSPHVIFVDDVGNFKTCKVEPVQITVHPKLTFEFKRKSAEGIFEYLTRSFVEDYMQRRISLEKSGWRTRIEIIKRGRVSRSSVYAADGGRGKAISELERRGLVEARVFPGERGRGGKILKMRIHYEKETIKRYLDQRIMKNK